MRGCSSERSATPPTRRSVYTAGIVRRVSLAFALLAMGLATSSMAWAQASQAPAGRGPATRTKPAPSAPDVATDADEQRDLQVMERFLTVLEKNPRRGTALDRIYGYHVERGTLDQLVERYRQRTANDAADAPAWMIVGLLESQRGHDAAAVAAFQNAEKAETKNYLAPYYLGQSLVLVGQPEAAAAAFERAIERKPPPTELLDVFQSLGRVYQRAQRNEQALAVWARLEKLFPDDQRVQEQIAAALAEEGEHAEALTRYKKLAQVAKDRYRQSLFRMEAGELELKLGRTPQALADFEALLAELNPDSWLYREVRRRIEEAFLRNDDQAGLAAYYSAWLEKHTEDVDAMARLAHTLATQGRVPEAQTWLDKAIKLAPSRKELRLTFVEQLVYDQRWPEAIAQYEALDKADPNNPDYLREWGQLLLRDKSRDEAERKAAAAAVWKRLADARPKDPLAATQVADLFRHAEMPEEALTYYLKAVELDPGSPQYREYLGEYYHTLKRADEALATWRAIAEGSNRNAKNLTRLAEVLSGFGYLSEAVKTMREACELEGDDLARQLKFADLLRQTEQYDAALVELEQADKVAENDDEREEVLKGQIKVYEAAERLSAEIDAAAKQLETAGQAGAADWYRLARLREAARQYPEATLAINKSLAIDGKSLLVLTAAARINESAGNLLEAANTYRQLATVDRRSRTLYLTEVAKLEARLGRRDAALAAGRDLLTAAPGNPEHYEFFAELCFQLGQNDEGLDTLRRSLRANPSDPKVLLTLAKTLADRFRTDEAIELYWRAFEKGAELQAKLDVVSRLADLYLQTNQFDRLLERLERLRREAKESRELSICVAQAYHAAGDYGTAGKELVQLLSQNPNDTQLLQQLATLLEAEGDLAEAAKYQQQLVHLAPTNEAEAKLAMLLSRAGQTEEAGAIWQRLTEREQEPEKIFRSIDSLIGAGKGAMALAITDRLLREQPNNWEALYREVVLLAADKPQEAAARCRAILDLRLDDDEPNAAVKAFRSREAHKPAALSSRQAAPFAQALPVQTRVQAVIQLRLATGLQVSAGYSLQPRTWVPDDFGQARMAALGWLLSFAERDKRADDFLAERRAALDEAEKSHNADRIARARWDWYYLQNVRRDFVQTFAAAKILAQGDDPLGQWVYLLSLTNRTLTTTTAAARNNDGTDNVEPLAADELERMLTAYHTLRQKRPELFSQGANFALVANNVITELRRAKRTDEERQVYRELLADANQATAISSLLALTAQRGDLDGTLELLGKLSKQSGGRSSAVTLQNYASTVARALCELMSERADAKQHADIARLYDRYCEYSRQQKRASTRPTSKRRSTASAQLGSYQIVIGKNKYKYVRFGFPVPNDYFDFSDIQLLRSAYELYKRDDLLTDLVAHLREAVSQDAPAADRIYPQLALAYIDSWEESPHEAVVDFGRACELAADDLNLKLELAELHETSGDLDEALALADSITPLDQATMQRRELLALRVAVRSGGIERARQAAERLFGLRLDAEMQVELASQMRQLGMQDLAEAVMARAQRQAGNRSSALVALMLQYQGQNKPEVAAQVAHQILRRTPVRQANPNSLQTGDDGTRSQAIAVLARTGKLKDMIARAEAQLKNSPNSVQIFQTLAEYYRAAGDRKKSLELYRQMAAARPDDARLQYTVALELSQSGDPAAAIELYRAAIKKEPRLIGSDYNHIAQTFRQAKKEDELVQLLGEIDLRAMGNYNTVTNLIRNMLNSGNQQQQAMKLFKLAWEAYPTQRDLLLGRMYDDRFWQLDEAYDYAHRALVPAGETAPANEWAGITSVMSYSGDGRINTLVTHFLNGAAKRNELESLASELQAAVQKYPQWPGGKLLLALVQIRRGQTDAGRAAIEGLLANKRSPMPSYACWIAGQELSERSELNDLAMKVYESTVGTNDSGINFSYSPLKRLVTLYHKAGRDDDARTLILKLAKGQDYSNYDPSYAAYQRLETNVSLGQELLTLGYAADAARIFNELLAHPELFDEAQQSYGNIDYPKQQAQQGLTKALEGLKSEGLRRAVDTLLQPSAKDGGKESTLDLVMLVQPRDLASAQVTSMLASVLKSAASVPEAQAAATKHLKQLTSDYAGDFSVQIAAALAACAGGNADDMATAIGRLQKLADDAPLDELPAGGRPNSRQRTEAARQIGLWLVARECARVESLRAAGDKLAERALQAARRQADPIYLLAMLRERGQAELDRGDRTAAERSWGEMLELVLPPPAEKKPAAQPVRPGPVDKNAALRTGSRRPSTLQTALRSALVVAAVLQLEQQGAVRAQRPAAVPAQRAPAATKPTGTPPATLAQFEQAMDIARLAAEHDMHDLSLRAVGELLRPGPPALPMKAMQRANVQAAVRVRSSQTTDDQGQVDQRVEQRLTLLDGLWKQHATPPEAVYRTLVEVVFPAGRPGEIVLYAPPLTMNTLQRPMSVGQTLVDWAVRAGCVDRLRQQVADRGGQPLAQLPAHVLLAQLGLAVADRQAATENLEWLSQRIVGETLQSSAELACHAALPALSDSELAAKAVGIVETAAKNLSVQASQRSTDEPAASLLLLLARHQLRHGAPAAGRQALFDYLSVCQQMNMRYVGDYGVYRRKQQLAKAATEFAISGQTDEALAMLGQYTDTQISTNYADIGVQAALAPLLQQLAALPADERYEKLKAWSLPTKDRKSVRLLAAFVPQPDIPEVFSQAKSTATAQSVAAGATRFRNGAGDLMSTLAMLVEAAQANGQIEELSEVARRAAHDPDQKIENAAPLEILIELVRQRPESVREAAVGLAAELPQMLTGTSARSSFTHWADYLVANACASNPTLIDVGGEMLAALTGHAQRTQNQALLAHLRIDVAEQTLNRLAQKRPDDVGELVPWHPASDSPATLHAAGAARPWWSVDGRQAVYTGGGGSDHLIFDYPLSGTFEVSADLLDNTWGEANLGYGGVCVEANTTGPLDVWPVGHHEQIRRTAGSFIRRGDYNHYTVRVSPEAVGFFINGHLVYRDDAPSPCAPWLDLFSHCERRTAFRNLRISGSPTIPRQVELVRGDRLDGWLANFYGESQPARLYEPKANNTTGNYYLFGDRTFYNYDWRAAEGILRGGRAVSLPPGSQSRLCYMRPLRDGETLRYEFLYEPDVTHVHPALDRLVFLIEPEGVALHWMTDGEGDSTGLSTGNVAAEPACRRGPQPLPLKAGDWNAMEVRLAQDAVTLMLNGHEIYRRPIEAANDRLFSFFHFKDRTGVQVRNVVLAGDDWPAELSQARRDNLLAPLDPRRDIDPAGLTEALLGEEIVSLGTWQVWQTARDLPAPERYAFLRDWVLPDPARGSIVRLYGDFTPTAPAPPMETSAGESIPDGVTSRRVQSGGDLVVPALDLIVVAKELGRLDELRSLVEGRTMGNPAAKQALFALIAMASDDDGAARQALIALYPHLSDAKGEEPEYRRWSALVAASTAAERPGLRPIAATILHRIADKSRATGGGKPAPGDWVSDLIDDRGRIAGARWERIARHLHARAQLVVAADPAPPNTVPYRGSLPLAQWQPAVHATAASRGGGRPRTHWQHRPGGLMHYSGHHRDYVYFAVPLRGDFDVEAELSTFFGRDTAVAYAATSLVLHHTRRTAILTNFERPRLEHPIEPPLDILGQWYRHRLSVRDGRCEVSVNGRKIFEERLPAEPDPWLAFAADSIYLSEVRNVRVTGTPAVPAELRLSAADNLNAWLAEYYAESVSGDQAQWEKRGEEIVGRKTPEASEGVVESLLQYHRPMFEDGEMRYEFYYQPGEATVAPALDRLAFLLEPAGVDIHWLTDAQHDRTGLRPDNRATEPENRRGPAALPLKERDWNEVRLTLSGDTVTLRLNDVEVYRRDLEPTNQRVFGLYHDATRSEARVRNVFYQGAWPRSLPPLAEQELAVSPAVRAALDADRLRATFECDFSPGAAPLGQLSLLPKTAEKYIKPSAKGARILLPPGDEKPAAVGYETNFRLRGDFEVVVVFSGLDTTCGAPAGGAGFDLHVPLDDAFHTELFLQRRRLHDGQQVVHTAASFDAPGKHDRPLQVAMSPIAAAAGKLKLVRKGHMVYSLFAEQDSDDYRLLHEHPAGEADARVELLAQAFTQACGTDMLLERLSIRAEAFVPSGSAR
ncbi:MAG TPA: DUF1583 domain-containing protein [Pirellulales bacterium]|nr:DUF1583 domain-containing protein [Pirellulales bacterium]